GTPIDSAAGGTTASVFDDNGNGTDTADSVAATDGNIADNISITNDGGLTGVTINTDGTIDVPAGTTAGTYTVTYQICLDVDNSICDTADVTIEVDPSINAENDDFSGTPIDSAAGGTTASVFADNGNGVDDADGSPASDANIADNISITNDGGLTGVTINTDGTIDVPAGTTAGTYTVTYQICLDVDNTICDTADVTIEVDPSINAENDDFSGTPIDSAAGGTTASVFDDNGNGTDTADGVAATDANIADNISITNDGGLTGVSINTDGTIDIPAGSTSGTYTITYQICLDVDNTICDTADVTIELAPSIDAVDDDFSGIPYNPVTGGTTASVFDDNGSGTDIADGVAATDANIDDTTIAISNDDGLTGVSINTDGTINVPTNASAGTYNVEYTICLGVDNTICDTATAIIEIGACLDFPTNDCDDDGVPNSADVCEGFDDTADADGDLVPDACDDDDDNDGLLDSFEKGQTTNTQPACGAQSLLDFSSVPTEESGDGNVATVLQGEVFRFTNVLTGVDALVTIVETRNATVGTLDDNSEEPNNFRPSTDFQNLNEGEVAYVEYNFDFVDSVSGTPVPVAEFFVNFNDIDGNTNISEKIWTQYPAAYTAETPSTLTFSDEGGFLNATSGVINFPGTTNVNPEINFSARYVNVTSFTFRLGAQINDAPFVFTQRRSNLEFNCIANYTNPLTTILDYDEDGIPNFLDSDSDNDGCPDAVEGDGGFTLADLDADDSLGDIVDPNGIPNVVTPGQNDVSSIDETVISTECFDPSINLLKSITSVTPGGAPGLIDDIITYEFVVTNTGNVDLTDITVNDPLIGAVTCVATTLIPGDFTTCSGTYTIIQDDIDNGGVENSASVSSEAPGGNTLDPSDDVTDVSDTGTAGDGSTITNPETDETPDLDTVNGDNNDMDPTNDPTTLVIPQNPSISIIKESSLDLGADGVVSVG
ncbi:beta strand repeat-containing protein, partial [uncultured Psychroserpens sp.]|uniref:beta strand repeat-containing protein n=2 Tax=uncultured Psychroserpens sp. TaxID=255436 RepID=UPI00345BD5C9